MTATELLAKYDIPGPRYTSYPTVPYWGRAPSPDEWLTHLEGAITRSRAAGQGGAMRWGDGVSMVTTSASEKFLWLR